MKILHLFARQLGTRPIHVTIPKRFVYFWEIANFLSKSFDVLSIDGVDPKYSIFYLTQKIIQEKYTVIVLLVRTENIHQSIYFSNFIKSINPEIKIIIYWDIVNLLPDFFKTIESIDAIVTSWDWEICIMDYIKYLESKWSILPSWIYLKETWTTYPWKFLLEYWEFPDTKQIPISFYNTLNNKKELTFSIARWCPYACNFCFSTCTFWSKERRKKVQDVVDYMISNSDLFDSFKLFAPTFNLDSSWVKEFCQEIIRRWIKLSWCATSRINLLLDEEVVSLMAESWCYKISVGIETLNESSKYLKKVFTKEHIQKAAILFAKYKIILKWLVMLWVPSQTKEDIQELFSLMKSNNILIRPTSYSPFEKLKNISPLTVELIQSFDKFTYYQSGISGISKEDFFNLMVNPNNFENIL